MSGLARTFRWFYVALMAALALPALAQIASFHTGEALRGTKTAPWPPMPQNLDDLQNLPRQLEAYVNDHFGWRKNFIRANGEIRYALASSAHPQVYVARGGQLVFRGDGMIAQSFGELQRRIDIANFIRFMKEQDTFWSARGVTFLVTSPPNASTILRAGAFGAEASLRTEADDLFAQLKAAHVPALDLRPVLLGTTQSPIYLKTDTHWNALGALIAYNAVVERIGHSDWRIDPQRVVRGASQEAGGDLARMMGLDGALTESAPRIDLAPYGPRPFTIKNFDTRQKETGGTITESGRDGPTVVILGDSFTENALRDYFALHVGKLIWMHHETCGFHQDIVESFKPDIVIYAPTERFAFCWGKYQPAQGQVQAAP